MKILPLPVAPAVALTLILAPFMGRAESPALRGTETKETVVGEAGSGKPAPLGQIKLTPEARPRLNRIRPSRDDEATNTTVARVQADLRKRGQYAGPVDGEVGPATKAAIRNFKRERGLPVNSQIDTSLLRALNR